MSFRTLVSMVVFLLLPASLEAQDWQPWEQVSDPFNLRGGAAVSWGPNRLDIFAIATNGNGRLWQRWFDGMGWPPAELRGPASGQLERGPVAVSWGPNRLDIFAVKALDGTPSHKSQLWHQWWDGSNWDEQPVDEVRLGYPLPFPVSWGPNRLDLFNQGAPSGTGLWHGWLDGQTWGHGGLGEWFDYGKVSAGKLSVDVTALDYGVSAVSWGPGRLDIFGTIGKPNYPTGTRLYHRWFDGRNWGAEWRDIPLVGLGWLDMVGGISAVSWGPGRLDLFAIRADGALWHYRFDGQHWAPDWDMLGSPPFGLVGTPSAVSWGPNRIDVFAVKADGGLWHQWWDGSWGSGESLASPPEALSGLSAVSWGPGRLDVFATSRTGSGKLWHIWYGTLPAAPKPTASLSANPGSIQVGSSSTLTWNTANATIVTLDSNPVALSGSNTVSPTVTTTYHLSATGPGGTQDATATVYVGSAPCQSGTTRSTIVSLPTTAPPAGGNVYFGADLTNWVINDPCPLQLTSITNQNNFAIELLASGHSSTECYSGSTATVDLPAFQTTTPAQLQTLYGSQTPAFRMQIAGCVLPQNAGGVALVIGSRIP